MSVADQLNVLRTNIANAYDSINTKGGTVPAQKNTANLASAIETIEGGGGGGSKTPEEVYATERPADWLKMPTPAENECYFLMLLPQEYSAKYTTTENIVAYDYWSETSQVQTITLGSLTPSATASEITSDDVIVDGNGNFGVVRSISGTDITVVSIENPNTEEYQKFELNAYNLSGQTVHFSYGTVVNGAFVASKTDDWTPSSSDANYSYSLYYNDFGDDISTGERQVMIKMDTSDLSGSGYVRPTLTSSGYLATNKEVKEYYLNSAMFRFGNFGSPYHQFSGVEFARFGSVYPSYTTMAYAFYENKDLKTILMDDLDMTSSVTNMSFMFQNCYSLQSVPLFDTSSVTDMPYMFQNCNSLQSVPLFDTSSVTNMSGMFQNCNSLQSANLLNYSFAKISGTSGLNNFMTSYKSGNTIYLSSDTSKYPSAGLASALVGSGTATVKIHGEDNILPLAANATTVFSTNANVLVYVPDSMYDTYAANTYWATLGTRLKKWSDL